MEDAERHLEGGVAEVVVERLELIRCAERLVDHGAERERGDVEVIAPFQALARAEGGLLAAVVRCCGRLEQRLQDRRRRGAGGGAERLGTNRHFAPAADRDSFRAARRLDRAPSGRPAEEHHRDPSPLFRQEGGR